MKTIERQIRNHLFEIRLLQDGDPQEILCGPIYRVDGVEVHRDEFRSAIMLVSAEATK